MNLPNLKTEHGAMVVIGLGIVLNVADAYFSGNLPFSTQTATTSVIGQQVIRVNRVISQSLTIGTIAIILGAVLVLKHKRVFST
jgi:hypothetical protein